MTNEYNAEGLQEVQEKMDEEQEKGYRGTVPDKTPNHAYTVEGVTSGEATPETSADEEDEESDE